MSEIAERLAALQERIDQARAIAGRQDEVRLVAVSKTVPRERIQAAYDAGQRLFGENRVQEAVHKISELRGAMPEASWHLIGHLQSNKARLAVDHFDLIETVDSIALAERMNRMAADRQRVLPVLIEVNVGGEAAKNGMRPDELTVLERLAGLSHLDISGLMTVAPAADNPEDIRWVFRRLRLLRDELRERFSLSTLTELSMGMSGDFEAAVEEGATIVRLGRAIFGARPVAAAQSTR